MRIILLLRPNHPRLLELLPKKKKTRHSSPLIHFVTDFLGDSSPEPLPLPKWVPTYNSLEHDSAAWPTSHDKCCHCSSLRRLCNDNQMNYWAQEPFLEPLTWADFRIYQTHFHHRNPFRNQALFSFRNSRTKNVFGPTRHPSFLCFLKPLACSRTHKQNTLGSTRRVSTTRCVFGMTFSGTKKQKSGFKYRWLFPERGTRKYAGRDSFSLGTCLAHEQRLRNSRTTGLIWGSTRSVFTTEKCWGYFQKLRTLGNSIKGFSHVIQELIQELWSTCSRRFQNFFSFFF